jgi:DNA-binding FadR family transcriptional regulator
VIQDCRVCARCGAVWPVQARRETVAARGHPPDHDHGWPVSGRVPSILALAQEYGVSHRTSQRALTTLTDEGLIVAVRGKGFYVQRDQS